MLAASRALPSHFPGLSILPSFKRTIFYVPSLPKTPTPPSLSSTLNCRLYLPFYGESTRKLPRAPSTSAGSCLDPFIMLFLWLLWMSCLCFCLQPKSGETRNHPLSSIQGLRLQQFLSPSSSSSCPLPDHSHQPVTILLFLLFQKQPSSLLIPHTLPAAAPSLCFTAQ